MFPSVVATTVAEVVVTLVAKDDPAPDALDGKHVPLLVPIVCGQIYDDQMLPALIALFVDRIARSFQRFSQDRRRNYRVSHFAHQIVPHTVTGPTSSSTTTFT